MCCVTACVRTWGEDALDVHEAEPKGPGAPLPALMLASCLQTLRHGRGSGHGLEDGGAGLDGGCGGWEFSLCGRW